MDTEQPDVAVERDVLCDGPVVRGRDEEGVCGEEESACPPPPGRPRPLRTGAHGSRRPQHPGGHTQGTWAGPASGNPALASITSFSVLSGNPLYPAGNCAQQATCMSPPGTLSITKRHPSEAINTWGGSEDTLGRKDPMQGLGEVMITNTALPGQALDLLSPSH